MEQIGWFYSVSWNFPLFIQHVEHKSSHACDVQDRNMILSILPLKERCKGSLTHHISAVSLVIFSMPKLVLYLSEMHDPGNTET